MLMALGLVVFASCSDDRDDNPTIVSPTTFHVNTPALADQYLDLAKSDIIELTCSQPDYGFPANTQYTVQVSLDENMANYKEVEQTFKGAKLKVNAALLASTLTTCAVEQGKTEADFPMDIPVYLRVRAVMTTVNGTPIEGTEIVSQNIVKLSRVHLLFSLPPVNIPSNLYLVGDFCGWDWGKSLSMVPVYGTDNMFWHMVYISDKGIKFNQERSWDGGEIGYAGITVAGDLASEIVDGGGNIASSKPGWYLMIVTCGVQGRNITYEVQFNKPEVWLMGPCIGDSNWSELYDGALFTVPETADGDFVSPAFLGVPAAAQGVRAYVKVPGHEWWHTEFMVFDKKLLYRGTGGDQERVSGSIGQKLYINFGTETGEIK